MKLYFIEIKQITNGISYTDNTITIPHHNNIDENVLELIQQLSPFITDNTSILIHRKDFLRFIDSINEATNIPTKELFNKLRRKLRQEFDVNRIRFNPRTLATQEKIFILHKRSF